MAAALAVELLVALRHHPAGLHAPADSSPPGAAFPAGSTPQPLGLVPHQVRPTIFGIQVQHATALPLLACLLCPACQRGDHG